MKLGRIVVLLVLSALAGCGVETMGAAATGAAARKQELEQAQKSEQQARQKVDQAMQLQQERLQAAE
jgi:Na+-transporting methylmalonyl-CoA/oxaloacetate decarboxylase gamma subunit